MTVDTLREEPKRERHPHEVSEVLDFDPGEYLKTADNHDEAHTVVSHSDTTATGAELETLTDGSDAGALHTHDLGGDVVYSDNGDTADIDISEVTDVTIKTTDVTGVAVGDVLIAELRGTLLNNSGGTRTYIITPDFDGDFDPELSHGQTTNAAQRGLYVIRWDLTVAASNDAHIDSQVYTTTQADAAQWRDTDAASLGYHMWDESTNDLTGTITVALKIRSDSAAATQGFLVHSFVVRKVSST